MKYAFKMMAVMFLTFNIFLCFTIVNLQPSFSSTLDIITPAKQAIIYDHEADQVLFEKNADQLMKPASMAKVMTAYIVFDRIKDNLPSNITVFSASSSSQISGALKEKEHGLFTYYLFKWMSGDADINKDKSIQIIELSSYVSKNVKDQAAINGREQIPELQGDKDRFLVQFN